MLARRLALLIWGLFGTFASAQIAATHIYHNHMPNFWPYYDVTSYDATPIGGDIRYMYDGQVINLKANPPANYSFYLPSGAPMPHDDLVAYYTHHAKTGAYLYWPWQTAQNNRTYHPLSQTHVTMSASVINNVNSFMTTQNVAGYNDAFWGSPWRNTNRDLRTSNGKPALDLIHFTGHHAMGPLVGGDYFLKDLIYQNATLAQSYFLGGDFKSSKGFFPTELGFSERLIPELTKLGIEWSVIGNVHFSRTLRDYPYLNNPGVDCLISPPNRADLQNTSDIGGWEALQMFNEAQTTHNKFPFASIPHWVRYVDPETGADHRIAGIPVEQASSWEEGYQGSVSAGILHNYTDEANSLGRTQYFVIAHDGDNSSGRAGSGDTWNNSGAVTYSGSGVTGMGVDEYLSAYPIPANDVVHVQDGSWIDTRDSSSDPTWYHWHLPPCIWKGQFADFNNAMGTNYAPKKNQQGIDEGNTVSLEYGYHYLERNFALLQAALNYAQTAEQIWLDSHPNHWSPTSAMDHEITYPGNQLNPWMMSYPIKGDANNDYAGGANPAELAWYFLIASIDSGFGYYDENQDDHVKPTISFNQSLHFSESYVAANSSQDRTGPSIWWPQRWPYNPGSANNGKAEGWTTHYFDQNFAIYTYAYDLSGITDIKLKLRRHRDKRIDPLDNTCRVYDPSTLAASGVPNIDPAKVGPWLSYDMQVRDMDADINGVPWQPSTTEVLQIVPAQKIGDLYYTYLDAFRDEILDYYIEATDSKGNITRSKIQQVYVGAGTYRNDNGTLIEDVNGSIAGTYPFVTDKAPSRKINLYVEIDGSATLEVAHASDGLWSAPTLMEVSSIPGFAQTTLSYNSSDEAVQIRYRRNGGSWLPSEAGQSFRQGTWTIAADGSSSQGPPPCIGCSVTIYYNPGYATPYIHYREQGGVWTNPPGLAMTPSQDFDGYFEISLALTAADRLEVAFNDGNGTWDSGGGSNYLFEIGTWTFESGTISAGQPDPVILNPIAVTVHYQRSDQNYGNWGLHIWGNGVPATTWTDPVPFDDSDSWGGIANFTVDEGSSAVNFLLHSGDIKDIDSDRSFNPANHNEIWLVEGDTSVYTSQPGQTGNPIDITVHYQRHDDNYAAWGLHLWGNGVPATTWTSPLGFNDSDSWGGLAHFQVEETTSAINFLLHSGNLKDVDVDRSFNPQTSAEIWLIEGDATIYTSEPPDPSGDLEVTIHYQRNDGNYGSWGLHLWGDGIPSTSWDSPRTFEASDTWGALTRFNVALGSSRINLIVHSGNTKDIDSDRFFDPTVSPEIWLRQGDATIYTSQPNGSGSSSIRIHYQRSDGIYSGWGLHLWGHGLDPSETITSVNGTPSTDWNSPKDFAGTSAFGVYADILISDPNQVLNFIVHKGNDKDVQQDRSFTPATNTEIWLKQGDSSIYTSEPPGF